MNLQSFSDRFRRLLSAVAVLSVTGVASAAASYCTATYTISNAATNQIGYYNYANNTVVTVFSAASANSNAITQSPTNGNLYYIERTSNTLHKIDINSGVDTNIGALNPAPGFTVVGGTTDASGNFYVYQNNGTFARVDTASAAIVGGNYTAFVTPAGYTLDPNTNGDFAIDATGQNYVVAQATTVPAGLAPGTFLWKLNLTTGALTSPVPFRTNGTTQWAAGNTANGISIDPANGTALVSSGTGDGTSGGGVYRIDLNTGVTTFKVADATLTDLGTCAVLPNRPTLGKSFSPSSATGTSGTTALTLTVGNSNLAPIYLQTDLTDTLPTNMVVAATPGVSGTCNVAGNTVTATAGSGTLRLGAGARIPAGGCTLTVNVTATGVGSYVNTLPVNALNTTVGTNAAAASATFQVNQPPVAVNDTSSTPANTAKTFNVTGNDTDTAPGTVAVASTVFAATGQPTGSTLSNGNRTIAVPNEGVYTLDNLGNVTFTPVAGYSGTTTPVKYTVNDDQGATSNPANITVTVTPVAVADAANTAPSTLVNIPVLTNDLGTGKVLTSLLFPATGQPAGSTLSNGGKTLTNADGVYTIRPNGTVDLTPALGKTGPLSPVLYTFVDGAGQTSNAATITVTVSTIVPPVATNDSKTTPKNTAVTLEGSTNDTPKSLPIDNTSVVLTAGGTISNAGKTLTNAQGTYQVQANGTVIFTPVSTFAGTTTPVSYTVKDTSGATSNAATLTVTVTNQPPVANNVTNILVTSTAQAAALNPGVSGTDPDGSVVTYTVTALPTAAMGTLYCNAVALTTVPSTCAPAQLSFKPNPTFDGNATFQYTVTDDNGAVSVAAATYTIPVNKPPVAVNDASSTPANTAKTFSVTGNDTDTAPGTVAVASTVFAATGQPTGSTLSNGNRTITVPNEGTYTLDNLGNVTFTPVAGYSGTTTPVKYTVNDNQGATSNPANITVTVAVNANLTISKVGPAFFKPGDTLSYTLSVTNTGTAATGVSVTDTLPAGLTFVSASNGGTYDAGTRVVTWTLGNVANGATVTRTLTATAPAAASVETNNGPTSLVNSASVQSDQTPLLASTPTTSQLVYPKLSKRVRNVTQSGAFGTVGTGKPGEVLEYCIDFRNYGVGVAGFVISDSVPSNTNASLSAYGTGLGLQVVRGTTTTRTSTGGDADGGSLSAAALSLDLGTLVAAESGSVCFQSSIK